MENPAELKSVTDSFERPLTVDEQRVVKDSWLGTAWRKLQLAVPGLAARAELDPTHPAYISTDTVRDAVVQMVERKLRNPDMLRAWNGDTAGFTIDNSASAGKIYVSTDELAMFIPRNAPGPSGMYSIPLGAP